MADPWQRGYPPYGRELLCVSHMKLPNGRNVPQDSLDGFRSSSNGTVVLRRDLHRMLAACPLARLRTPSVRLGDYGHTTGFVMVLPAREKVMLMTPEEFMAHPVPDGKAELVRGELRVTPPPGGSHGLAATNLLYLIESHARPGKLGRAFSDGTGYELLQVPRTVRMPDVSFVRAERLPEEGVGASLLRLAPDLAVEVLSPSEAAWELQEKLDDYTAAGTPLIWVVDPARRIVMIAAANAPLRWLHEADTLDGGDVIPGFRCGVSEIFVGIAREAGHAASPGT
jgi:Uma2 family endonuclease